MFGPRLPLKAACLCQENASPQLACRGLSSMSQDVEKLQPRETFLTHQALAVLRVCVRLSQPPRYLWHSGDGWDPPFPQDPWPSNGLGAGQGLLGQPGSVWGEVGAIWAYGGEGVGGDSWWFPHSLRHSRAACGHHRLTPLAVALGHLHGSLCLHPLSAPGPSALQQMLGPRKPAGRSQLLQLLGRPRSPSRHPDWLQ